MAASQLQECRVSVLASGATMYHSRMQVDCTDRASSACFEHQIRSQVKTHTSQVYAASSLCQHERCCISCHFDCGDINYEQSADKFRYGIAGIGTCQSRTPDIPYTLVSGDVASSIIVASMAATAAGQGNQEGPNITQACTSCSNPITLRQLTDEICQYYRCCCMPHPHGTAP